MQLELIMISIEASLIFLIVSLTAFYFINNWKTNRICELSAKLPGHNGLSLLSSIYIILTTKRKNYVSKTLSYVVDDFPMTKIWFFNELLIITKDADFSYKIFNSNKTYDKPKVFYQSLLVKNSLLVMSGAEHKRHRKILNKAFTSKMLERIPKVSDEKSKKILNLMEERVNCGEFELTDYIGAYSFESFGKSNYNYEIDYYKSKIVQAYAGYCSLMVDTLPFFLIGLSRKLLNYFKLGKSLIQVENEFDKFINNIHEANSKASKRDENTVVDLLLDPNNKFNKQEVKDELIMTMFGAYETTARTVSTALMMLGMHKDVQQKAVNEIDEIYSQDDNPELTNDFLQKFTYLELILKETMRLFAVAPIVARETSEEVNINGFLLPKNSTILILIDAMHRDKKYWGNDADKFRPERFEDEIVNQHAFAPFTLGSRICIGHRYSMISMKIFLINFLRKYKVDCLTKLEEIETESTLTLNFLKGYTVSISKRGA
ncbi:hypothetical protein ACKWTF_016302 [Chironomus riparius]